MRDNYTSLYSSFPEIEQKSEVSCLKINGLKSREKESVNTLVRVVYKLAFFY